MASNVFDVSFSNRRLQISGQKRFRNRSESVELGDEPLFFGHFIFRKWTELFVGKGRPSSKLHVTVGRFQIGISNRTVSGVKARVGPLEED